MDSKDFEAHLKEAKEVLKQRDKQYGSYTQHVETFIKVTDSLDYQLFTNLKCKREPTIKDNRLITHAAYSLSLKFTRIISNPKYEDSYIDALGYLLLFMQATGLQSIKLRPLDFIDKDHEANRLISFINKTFREGE